MKFFAVKVIVVGMRESGRLRSYWGDQQGNLCRTPSPLPSPPPIIWAVPPWGIYSLPLCISVTSFPLMEISTKPCFFLDLKYTKLFYIQRVLHLPVSCLDLCGSRRPHGGMPIMGGVGGIKSLHFIK